MWVRGLKLALSAARSSVTSVASYVGAWIETPLALTLLMPMIMSHPMWVRGLKQQELRLTTFDAESHPMWVRGLKLDFTKLSFKFGMSHPMWVRGLKPISIFINCLQH